MNKQKKVLIVSVLVISMILGLAACAKSPASYDGLMEGGENSTSYSKSISKSDEMYYSADRSDYIHEEAGKTDDPLIGIARPDVFSDEKLIYICNISLQTKAFKETLESISEKIKEYKGFVQYEKQTDNAGGWYLQKYEKTSGTLREMITVRIPTEKLNDFLSDLSGYGKILSRDMNVQNITSAYNDVQSEIEVLEKKEQSYIEMMGNAKSTEEMLAIDQYLTDVQKQLAVLKNQISNWDTDLAYSTVTLTVDEVLEYDVQKEEKTFWTRLGETLKSSGEFFLEAMEFLLNVFIFILPFGIIIAGIVILCVLLSKKRKAKLAAKKAAAKKPETMNPVNPEN